jgi:hypothetical protein
MTLYQFNALDETEQHEAVWNHGVMVGERIEDQHRVLLYQLFSFYIELYYHTEYNVLRRLRSFSNTECLDAYIDTLDLGSLTTTEPQ